MSHPERLQGGEAHLSQAVADLEEISALAIVRRRLEQGDDPMRIIDDCQAGMRQVGERYAQQRYFLSALIMAGDILAQIMNLVMPGVEARFVDRSAGRVLIGTVQGDIHDLGKNLVSILLRAHGFTVRDLGVDVPAETFLAEARALRPHVIGLSGLITAAYSTMRHTTAVLQTMMAEDGSHIPIIIGTLYY